MQSIILPAATPIIQSQPFSREPVEQMFEELCTPVHEFTGYVRIEFSEKLYLLFLFGSRPYSAAKFNENTSTTISIRDFFKEVGSIDDKNAFISIHATDPVLLKSLLVFMQNKPTFKAPAEFINIDAIVERIGQESADALIVLETQQKLDFCFFKNGTSAMCYPAEPTSQNNEDTPAAEQIRALATRSGNRMNFMIYRDLSTSEDSEALTVSQKEMLELLRGNEPASGSRDNLILAVLEGPQKGAKLTGPIPCVLGRKDTDIIVSDSLVSKRHATIQRLNAKLIIMDLNSTNGTFLNGIQVKQQEISVGDDILIGGTMMRIEKLSSP